MSIKKTESSIGLLASLYDPFILISQKYHKILLQSEQQLLDAVSKINFIAWPLIYLTTYFLNDLTKPNPEMWRSYRFSVIGITLLLAAINRILKKSLFAQKATLFGIAFLFSYSFSWSMTLGQAVQSKWITIFPTIILMFASRSFILSALFLSLTVFISSNYWEPFVKKTWMVTDVEIACFVLLLSYAGRVLWINTKVNKIVNEELRQNLIQQQEIFYNQVTRFISPVYINKIHELTKRGYSYISAVDEVLKLRETTLAVLYSDLRNYSTRSNDIEFIKNELIPSAIKIIDPAENNQGVARQIGDAIFIFYDLDDPEEGLLRALKDGLRGSLLEWDRIKKLGRYEPERFFSLSYGNAIVGNIASNNHREATISGDPANLGARLDTLTKNSAFKSIMPKNALVICEPKSASILKSFSRELELTKINLGDLEIKLKSYEDIDSIYIVSATKNNISIVNKLLTVNSIKPIEAELL